MANRTAKEKAYWAGREKLANTKIKKAADIAKLPWHGNHASDNGLFIACEKFIKAQKSRETQRRALWLMGKYGMGISGKVTEHELNEFLSN